MVWYRQSNATEPGIWTVIVVAPGILWRGQCGATWEQVERQLLGYRYKRSGRQVIVTGPLL